MIKKEYKTKKIKELEIYKMEMSQGAYNLLEKFLSKTIDETWSKAYKQGKKDEGESPTY